MRIISDNSGQICYPAQALSRSEVHLQAFGSHVSSTFRKDSRIEFSCGKSCQNPHGHQSTRNRAHNAGDARLQELKN